MQIPAGEFKAKCLKLMEHVARTGKPIVITKRGVPVAKLMPPDHLVPRRPLFGCMAGTVAFEGDLLTPLDVEWAAPAGKEAGLDRNLAKPRGKRAIVKPAPRRKTK